MQEGREMNKEYQERPASKGQRRLAAGLVAAGAVSTWLAAALLVWGFVPQAVSDPALADSAAVVASGIGAFALVGTLAGIVMLVGLLLTWLAPRRAIGRVLLLVAGLVATTTGLLLLNL